MKKYSLLALSLLLMGCGSGSVYDDYGNDALLARVNAAYEAENYAASRDAAESFIARFPQDEQIDLVRLKLLASYVYSSHFIMASAYADRLLEGALLNEMYYEDVEYYKILLTIGKSKHGYAGMLRMKNVFRNFSELESVIGQINGFIQEYPSSSYLEELEDCRAEIRHVLAEHQLNIALHYAQKGNFEAMNQRLALYNEKYGDIQTPLLDKVQSYAKKHKVSE